MAPRSRGPRRPRRAQAGAERFYAGALNEGEREALPDAERVEGLDQEVALLRLRLRRALEERPEDFPLMLRGVELLVKAVSARYRLSARAQEDLADSLVGVLNSVSSVLFPEGGDGSAGY